MITEFSVTNFYSYKDKVTFSMLASNSSFNNDNYIIKGDRKILKTAAIYGANASGKSNLFKILTNVILMIRKSRNVDSNLNLPIVPFKLDKESINEPSEFEIKFIYDNVRYVYGFKASVKKIFEEYLYYYPNGREALIFDRCFNKYEFPRDDKKELEDISEKVPENRLFLPSAAYWNNRKCKKVFDFFNYSINTINNLNELQDMSTKRYFETQKLEDNKLKKFALDCLKKADVNIEDFNVIEVDIPNELLSMIPDVFKKSMGDKPKGYGIYFKHKNSDSLLTLEEESAGTQVLFNFIPYLMDAVNNEFVLFIDELDRSLHPLLTEMIVNMFNSSKTNKGNAQLIFNTHDSYLLETNILRKDQIWFVEKDNESAVSCLKCLNDFKIKSGNNYEKMYLIGKYGAIPNIDNNFILDEEN